MGYFFGALKSHTHGSGVGDGGALGATSTLMGTDLIAQILAYRRPNVVYTSGSTATAENNTGTASETAVMFPDWDYRTDTTASHRILDTTRNAIFNGSNQSGIRSGAVVNSTVYAVYAVKCSNNTTDFVLVADTVFDTQANFATLNTNFGTNSWVFLNYIFYGDNGAVTSAIIPFRQAGPLTLFNNVLSDGVGSPAGIKLASTGGATTLTWTYASGSSITSAQLPSTISHILVTQSQQSAALTMQMQNSGATFIITNTAGDVTAGRQLVYAQDGIKLTVGASKAMAIHMVGFYDAVLASTGINPFI